LLTASESSRLPGAKPILRYNGVEKTKTDSRNINLPHGILLQMFCNFDGFDVDKSFIVDTFNQTGKTSRELSKNNIFIDSITQACYDRLRGKFQVTKTSYTP
jgi:hypothetical protein